MTAGQLGMPWMSVLGRDITTADMEKVRKLPIEALVEQGIYKRRASKPVSSESEPSRYCVTNLLIPISRPCFARVREAVVAMSRAVRERATSFRYRTCRDGVVTSG